MKFLLNVFAEFSKFTKLLKPVLSKLRRSGIILAISIDDGWVKGLTYDDCFRNVIATVQLFSKLGFLLHEEKSVLIPSQHVSILGYNVDSLEMLVTLGDDKTNNAIKELEPATSCVGDLDATTALERHM